jgi:hypothetical protein
MGWVFYRSCAFGKKLKEGILDDKGNSIKFNIVARHHYCFQYQLGALST